MNMLLHHSRSVAELIRNMWTTRSWNQPAGSGCPCRRWEAPSGGTQGVCWTPH